jgi:hypothetical protein
MIFVYPFTSTVRLLGSSTYTSQGENALRCTTQDEKGLILIVVFFTLYIDPHKK